MSENKKNSVTMTGSITAVNSTILAYLYWRLSNTEKQVDKESNFSKVIRRNLNLLNMKFKSTSVEADINNRKREDDILELRSIIMSQNDRIDALERDAKIIGSGYIFKGEFVSPLIMDDNSSVSTPEMKYGQTLTGNRTEKFY